MIDPDTEIESADGDADLKAGFAKFRAETEPQQEPAAESPPASGATVTPPAPATEATKERAENGQFVKRKAPVSWRKEAQEKWDGVDPLLQEEIEKRENDQRDGISKYKSKADFAEAFEKTVQPYMPTLQGLGIHPLKAIESLMRTDASLRDGTPEQRQQAGLRLLQSYGITLDGAQPEQAAGDHRLEALQQQVQQLSGYIQTQAQREHQAQAQKAFEELDSFSKKAPHLDAVREDMAVLLRTGRAKDLQEAYDKAVWGRAELRDSLIAEQQSGKATEAAKVAANARAAAAVNVPVKGKVTAGAPELSADDELRAGIRKFGVFSR